MLVDKSYCTQTDVERAMGVAAAETNVTQAQILSSIKSASDEIDIITHTRYHSVEDSGTAESGTMTTLTDTDKTWTINEWENYVLWIHTGTGSDQYARILSNTSTVLTLDSDDTLTTAPGATSQYRILPDVIHAENLDGNNLDHMFIEPYPIKKLISLVIDDTTVTATSVYVYEKTGELRLHTELSTEKSYFLDDHPQDIELKWVFGLYPIPRNIIRLTATIAGIQCLITQIGGTYNDVTSYSIPHFTASKGEPYTNIREALTRLEKEMNRMVSKVKKYVSVVG